MDIQDGSIVLQFRANICIQAGMTKASKFGILKLVKWLMSWLRMRMESHVLLLQMEICILDLTIIIYLHGTWLKLKNVSLNET